MSRQRPRSPGAAPRWRGSGGARRVRTARGDDAGADPKGGESVLPRTWARWSINRASPGLGLADVTPQPFLTAVWLAASGAAATAALPPACTPGDSTRRPSSSCSPDYGETFRVETSSLVKLRHPIAAIRAPDARRPSVLRTSVDTVGGVGGARRVDRKVCARETGRGWGPREATPSPQCVRSNRLG